MHQPYRKIFFHRTELFSLFLRVRTSFVTICIGFVTILITTRSWLWPAQIWLISSRMFFIFTFITSSIIWWTFTILCWSRFWELNRKKHFLAVVNVLTVDRRAEMVWKYKKKIEASYRGYHWFCGGTWTVDTDSQELFLSHKTRWLLSQSWLQILSD